MRVARIAFHGVLVGILVAANVARGGEGAPADSIGPPPVASPAPALPADSTAAPPDSTAPVAPPWVPDPSHETLRNFRPERSADVETRLLGSRSDAVERAGLVSLAGYLRLSPGVRTREMSQGPTAESFDLSGAGSAHSALLGPGTPFTMPGTGGPHSQEVGLGEIDGFSIVRGGAGALYGPDAVDGAVVTLPRDPLPDELTTRATAEEGVDDWQRGAFQLARRLGSSGGLFAATESRRIEGFYPGTKEVDRLFTGRVYGRLGHREEGRFDYRHYQGDGRMGGFDFGTIRSVLTKRDDLHAEVFRRSPAGGALVEAHLAREKLETGISGPDPTTRNFLVPSLRITADLPSRGGLVATARAEVAHVRVETEEIFRTDSWLQSAAALRVTRAAGPGFLTGTARLDADGDRPLQPQVRFEAELPAGRSTWFAIASRGERLPDRAAAAPDDAEVLLTGQAGVRLETGPFLWRGAAFATNVTDLRREPTFEEIRSRLPVLDGPQGDAELRGASAGFESRLFAAPGLSWMGALQMRSSVTGLSARNVTTDTRLPRRPRFTWTGDGSLEHRFFQDQLLVRLRGRLTHERDRVDESGAPVVDAWVTDVLLEGEVGDAVFFYRFHDLPQRADEIEPGIRLPGFSRMWGVTWRFLG